MEVSAVNGQEAKEKVTEKKRVSNGNLNRKIDDETGEDQKNEFFDAQERLDDKVDDGIEEMDNKDVKMGDSADDSNNNGISLETNGAETEWKLKNGHQSNDTTTNGLHSAQTATDTSTDSLSTTGISLKTPSSFMTSTTPSSSSSSASASAVRISEPLPIAASTRPNVTPTPIGNSGNEFDYLFKILIIGNSSVGKTCFLFRYTDHSFSPNFISTVGIDFKVKTVIRNGKKIKLQARWVGFFFHL